MNYNRLKELEKEFLERFPLGFYSPEMVVMGKKHKLHKVRDYLLEVCSKENMKLGLSVYDDIMKAVTKSSMVSVFEKVRFRDLAKEFDNAEKHFLLDSIYELLHGDEERGFNMMVSLLHPFKLAKWPILTMWRVYWNLDYDVFMKPTTVKKILKALEVEDIKYEVKPSYELYAKYRTFLNSLKEHLDESLYPNNPAFSGFFMMTID